MPRRQQQLQLKKKEQPQPVPLWGALTSAQQGCILHMAPTSWPAPSSSDRTTPTTGLLPAVLEQQQREPAPQVLPRLSVSQMKAEEWPQPVPLLGALSYAQQRYIHMYPYMAPTSWQAPGSSDLTTLATGLLPVSSKEQHFLAPHLQLPPRLPGRRSYGGCFLRPAPIWSRSHCRAEVIVL